MREYLKTIGDCELQYLVNAVADDWIRSIIKDEIVERQNKKTNTQPQTEEKLTGRKEGVDKGVDRGDTPEEKYKKGDKVKLTLADKDGWITGEFEVAGVEVEQTEENEPEKIYVDPIVPNFTEELSAPVEYKTREEIKEMFKDTPEEWVEDLWGLLDSIVEEDINKKEIVGKVRELLDEKEREVRKQERMIRLHWRESKLKSKQE